VSSIAISCVAFACVFGGALLAMFVGRALPERHLSGDSKDVIKLMMALMATLAALVLGLLIATTKATFDTQSSAIKQISTNVILLDRVLANYGSETQDARGLLHRSAALTLDRIWPANNARPADLAPGEERREMHIFYDEVAALSPQKDARASLKARALQITFDLAQTRYQLFVQEDSSIPLPFLVVLVFWLTMLFAGYGLLAPRNPTVIAALFVCTLSVSGAIFLILEMAKPLEGTMRISSAPLHDALSHLGE
jgi:hypothetical protein